MQRFTLAVGVVLAAVSMSSAAQVWESTFPDGNTDGVVDIFAQNINGTVMIGSSAGGTQVITTESLTVTFETNKAGRPVGAPVTRNTSASALYTFDWSKLEGAPGTAGIEYYAGFTSNAGGSGQHNTRHQLGARFIRAVAPNGDHLVQMFGAFASHGQTNAGRNLPAGQVNLGQNLVGRPLQLAIGWDSTTEILDVGLFDGVTGAELIRSTGDVKLFDGIVQHTPANIQGELNALSQTHLGWTDHSAGINDVETDWNTDALAYYNDATGAFDDVVPEPATALMMLLGLTAVIRRRR